MATSGAFAVAATECGYVMIRGLVRFPGRVSRAVLAAHVVLLAAANTPAGLAAASTAAEICNTVYTPPAPNSANGLSSGRFYTGAMLHGAGLNRCSPSSVGDASRSDGSTLVYRPVRPLLSAQNPCYSPDSSAILFTTWQAGYNNGDAHLDRIPATGGTPAPVVTLGSQAAVNLPNTCWNKPLGRITFAWDYTSPHPRCASVTDEVWTSLPQADSRHGGVPLSPVQVTCHTSNHHYQEPSFSPDGRWIVFEEIPNTSGEPPWGNIWKVHPDGSGLTELVVGDGSTGHGLTENREPNWSPANNSIVFQRAMGPNGGDFDVWTVNTDGTLQRDLTANPTHCRNPQHSSDTDAGFSPSGKWIVYSSDYAGTSSSGSCLALLDNANLWAISIGGGKPVRITDQPHYYDGAPSWAPNDRYIAYESDFVSNQRSDMPTGIWRVPVPPGM